MPSARGGPCRSRSAMETGSWRSPRGVALVCRSLPMFPSLTQRRVTLGATSTCFPSASSLARWAGPGLRRAGAEWREGSACWRSRGARGRRTRTTRQHSRRSTETRSTRPSIDPVVARRQVPPQRSALGGTQRTSPPIPGAARHPPAGLSLHRPSTHAFKAQNTPGGEQVNVWQGRRRWYGNKFECLFSSVYRVDSATAVGV